MCNGTLTETERQNSNLTKYYFNSWDKVLFKIDNVKMAKIERERYLGLGDMEEREGETKAYVTYSFYS